MSELFDIEPSLSPRLEWEREWRIATHCSEFADPPWIAVSFKQVVGTMIGDARLTMTQGEQEDIMSLMAGWCGWLEDRRMIGYGATRDEAINELVENSGKASRAITPFLAEQLSTHQTQP